ncbi:hypothetical protein ABFS83_14G018300 [Erythranthe nasuta]
MGHALFDLEQVLLSKKGQQQLTAEETNMMMTWRATGLKEFTKGFCTGSVLGWLATRRLRTLYRVNLAVSGAAVYGLYRFGRSAEKTVTNILALEGSRLQSEMANIMLQKHQNEPWVVQSLSKRFYSEEVYDDSSVDKPSLRWRFRNFSGDPITHSQNTTYTDETNSNENNFKNTTTLEPKQVYVNGGGNNTTESPFDLVFGFRENVEIAPQPDSPSSALSKKSKLKEKRMRRRRRRHHHEEEDSDI